MIETPDLNTEVLPSFSEITALPVLIVPLTRQILAQDGRLPDALLSALSRAGTDVKSEIESSVLVHQSGDAIQRVLFVGLGEEEHATAEVCREATGRAAKQINQLNVDHAAIYMDSSLGNMAQPLVEGFWLGAYQYRRYKTDDAPTAVTRLSVIREGADISESVERAKHLARAVYTVRDLVNRSPDEKTAVQFADMVSESGRLHGYDVEVWDATRIEKEEMGGLLAVNRGSEDPPTFSLLSWKPEESVNSQPIVLVGKGVMYDTGGLSLKDTKGSMDLMKSDMAGAATVVGIFEALANLNISLHVVGLLPATDNRPGGRAYVPGDIIKMHSGIMVEVLNTDAEGRLLLADALSYAQQLDPEFVVDMATLTGAAITVLGHEASPLMSNLEEDNDHLQRIRRLSTVSGESIHPLPLYDAYAKLLKSDVADIKNVGGRAAGCITAGKFLEHFVDYPWVHLDIAGTAFLQEAKPYRPVGGTGFGVRLLVDVLSEMASSSS